MARTGLSRRSFGALSVAAAASTLSPFMRSARSATPTLNVSFFGAIPQPATYMAASKQLEQSLGGKASLNAVSVNAGPQLISGLASGQLDIGPIGMPPMISALASGLDISMVYVGHIQDKNEALVVRPDSGIAAIGDLRGKTIGVAFNTEVHYALLKVLRQAGIDLSELTLVNMPPNSVFAAYQRREIHGAYVWSPMLDQIQREGAVTLTTAGDLKRAGSPLFDGFIVRNDFKRQHPELVLAYLQEVARANQLFRTDLAEVNTTLAKFLSADIQIINAYTSTFDTITPAEMVEPRWMGPPGARETGVARSLADVGDFLRETNQIKRKPGDMSVFVDGSFVARMV